MASAVAQIDPKNYQIFRFSDYRFDEKTGQAEFDFELRASTDTAASTDLRFTEHIAFQMPERDSKQVAIDLARLDALLPLLGAVIGTSYFKIASPPVVELTAGIFTESALNYLEQVYSFGLGEFAYRAGLDGLPQPEFRHLPTKNDQPILKPSPDRVNHPLVPVGGGKDSAVTVASLTKAGFLITPFAVNPNAIIRRVSEYNDGDLVVARRKLDPLLFDVNNRGAMNGHVPVTAMNSLIAVIQSLLLGLGPVVMSNESSSSEPTLIWDGVPVNHQWSKSLDAEAALEAALTSQAGLSGFYFSLLRPFAELRIAKAFSRTDGFDQLIVSCNRAFRIHDAAPTWCCDCAKCQFVFLAFAPFMSSQRLTRIFGKNMFDDLTQLQGFREIIGLDHHKPWECVGEQAESVYAISLAANSDEWRNTAVIQALVEEAPELAQLEANPFEDQVFGRRAGLPLPNDSYLKAQDEVR